MRQLSLVGFGLVMLFFVMGEYPKASDHPSGDIRVRSLMATITMNDWEPYYKPFVANVPPETPVRWVNPTPSPHSVRHDGCRTDGPCRFNSGTVEPDEQFVLPGLPPGRYPYHCEIHPIMRGILVVKGEDLQSRQGS